MPVNDNDPELNDLTNPVTFTENQPVLVFPELIISDLDEFCDPKANVLTSASMRLTLFDHNSEEIIVSTSSCV